MSVNELPLCFVKYTNFIKQHSFQMIQTFRLVYNFNYNIYHSLLFCNILIMFMITIRKRKSVV